MGSPHYQHCLALNLLLLTWLQNLQHPVWKVLSRNPEAFSEEKGESSLSLLFPYNLPSKETIKRLRQHYQIIPHVHEFLNTYTFASKFSSPKPTIYPLYHSDPTIQQLLRHFSNVFQALQNRTWQYYQKSTQVYSTDNVTLTSELLPTTFSFYPSAEHLNKLFHSLKKTFWDNNSWGSSVEHLFLNQNTLYADLGLLSSTETQPEEETLTSTTLSSDPSLSEPQLWINLQPDFLITPNDTFLFYS